MTMTAEEYIAEKRATIDAHQAERETLAPTLPTLAAAVQTAQGALDALNETATDEQTLTARTSLEAATADHSAAQARFKALRSEIDRLRLEVTEVEADPAAVTAKLLAVAKAEAMRGAGIDPDRPQTMILFVAGYVRLLADLVETLHDSEIDANAKAKLAEGRALLETLSEQ